MPDEAKHLTLTFIDVPNIVNVREDSGEDAARQFLLDCTNALNDVRQIYGGVKVRSVGSTVLMAFEHADDAVRASCEVQALSDVWVQETPVPTFRIGVHAGDVFLRNGSFVGEVVSKSARLVTIAKPGQTVASEAVASQMPPSMSSQLVELPADPAVRERLPFRLYEVIWRPDGRSSDPSSPGADRAFPGLDYDEIAKTHTAPLVMTDERPRRKIKLTEVHRKSPGQVAAPDEAPDASVVVGVAETARLCLVWDRHVVVVDSRKPAVSMGRAATNDIVVEIHTASRQHAHVEWRGGTFYLVDHSWNGTYVYDDHGEERLVHNDETPLRGNGMICPGCPGSETEAAPIRYIEAD